MRHHRTQSVIRIVTDQGISGYSQASPRSHTSPMVAYYKDYLVGRTQPTSTAS
jgi:hypothetical protein